MAKNDWRDAIKKEMKKAAEEEAEKRSGKKKPPFRYRWEHVKAVVATGIQLAKLTGADVEIVEAACWLHDVKKFESKSRHPQDGAKFARRFLPKTNFPRKKIEAVAVAIENHMGLWRDDPLTNLEAAVLWDADKLTKIGLTAAFHWVGNALATDDAELSTRDLVVMGQDADWQAKTVASMHTKQAKKAAAARLKRYNALWKNLSQELDAQDLR